MRLKLIKLAGFKSFVDSTKIPFINALSAIIGPNGCGKSNVIDAVRWVLGESSAKHLRGDSMTDVIFNGSGGRRPVSVAGVELVFENTQGRLTGQYAAYQEISVKRQVSRDGESNYFLNGQKCRRKDITDLFMGTGLGPRSYAIIEQGTISRLIESKPQELRVFIEEAAGISRYKERRRETENRIRHTRENLERLGDIRVELGQQLAKLSQQAQAARQYRELKQAERETQGQLLVMRYQQLQTQMAGLKAQTQTLELDIEAGHALLQAIQLELTEQQVLQAELSQQEQTGVESYYQTGTALATLEQQIQNQQQRDAQQQAQLSQLAEQLLAHEAKLAQYQADSQGIAAELAALAPAQALAEEAHDELQAQWEQRQGEQQAQAEALGLVNERVSAARLELELTRNKLGHCEQVLAHKQTQSDAQRAQLQALEARAEGDNPALLDEGLAKLDAELDWQYERNLALEEACQEGEQALEEMRQGAEAASQGLAAMQARLELIAQWLAAGATESDRPQLWQRLEVTNGWEKAAELVLDGLLTRELGVSGDDPGFESMAYGAQSEGAQAYLGAAVNLSPWLKHLHWAHDLAAARGLLPTLAAHERIVTADGYLLGHGFLLTKTEGAQSLVQLSKEQERLTCDISQAQAGSASLQADMRRLGEALTQHKQALQQGQQRLHRLQLEKTTLELQRTALAEQMAERGGRQQELGRLLAATAAEIEQQQAGLEALGELESSLSRQLDTQLELQHQLQAQAQTASSQSRDLKARLDELTRQRQAQAAQKQTLTMKLAVTAEQVQQQSQRVEEALQSRRQLEGQLTAQQSKQGEQNAAQLQEGLALLLARQESQQQQLQAIRLRQAQVQEGLDGTGLKQKQELGRLEGLTQTLSTLKLRHEGLKGQAQSQLQLLQEAEIQLDSVAVNIPAEATPDSWQQRLDKLRAKIARLGAINLAAIEEFEQQSERKQYLDSQDEDLTKGLATLEEAIRKIDKETRSRFKLTFDSVNQDLGRLFPKVFGGGHAYLALTDDDLLETGVTIMAQPPGKKNSTIHLLSGGEKALTALSLVFAIFRLNPAPFCMLDEVDAPLDDANVERFCRLLQEMSQSVQFIYISHNKITMEMADQLIGVTMHEPGVSRIVAVDIEEALALADAG
ncbi:chromosome segregation protein SMC [Shewanella salipaludis]|uniref:Chromosome partition protein Smc n=1 Tax=Shewanella salipaludis TaxID=2723052 RepID=A0A972G7W6_9GAMM|nr:chromosome segregation protein SMC [Shewanella salipaludis]NMH66120.1 chromosome segregation protein SMC [Shewanella salipaludis]